MNQVLLLVRDNFEMNKRAIDSIFAQDIPTELTIIDNSNKDETLDWALTNKIRIYPFRPQVGVSKGWNLGLGRIFDKGAEHVLVPNSDTVLAPWTYRHLLSYDFPFVTGVSVNRMEQIYIEPPMNLIPSPHPDMSNFLIRRECWEKVGPFDENMKHYASDMDYHVRGHRAGIKMMNSGVPFYHERSSTIKNATQEDRQEIESQANKDRAAFRAKWGVECNSPDYQELFK